MKASVPVQSGMTELWTVTDGTGTGAIASGQGTQVVGFRAGTGLGTFQVGADVQNQADASVSAAATVTVQTGTWLVEDGSPLLTRPNGTTTLLANGRVLVAGGTNGMNDSFNSAEIYDPGTRAWMATAPMGTGRQYQTATLLNDGTVLVTGGLSSFGGTALASAEIFNPNVVPATWTPAAPMAAARTGHLATLLKDGTVLVAGGGDGSGHGLASAEIYNPNVSPATWTTVAPMTTTRYLFTATLLADGTVLVAGGDSTGASAEIYDPNVSPATWTLVAPMTTVRSCPTATLLADGTVLVAGGYGSGSSILDSTEIYNPNVSPATWTLVAPMNTARSCHTATLLADGTVLVAGGCGSGSGSGSSILDSTEIYNPNVSPATWTVSAPMASVHYGHSATLLKDGTVLVAEGSPYSDPEIYDPNGTPGTWTSPVPPGAGNDGPTTTLLADGTVLASGGVDPSWNASTAAIIYDPSAPAQGWKAVAPMGTGRIRQAATRLNDGTVLVMGGASGYFGSVLNSAEVFNPAASPATWTAVAPMTTVRTSHTATLLADGTVLVAGGVGSGAIASAEIYDPKVSPATWTAAAPMNEARYGHTATLLADGTVLVAGGYARWKPRQRRDLQPERVAGDLDDGGSHEHGAQRPDGHPAGGRNGPDGGRRCGRDQRRDLRPERFPGHLDDDGSHECGADRPSGHPAGGRDGPGGGR